MTTNKIIASARECIGTPFRHQGRAPGQGLDCAGLVVVSLKAAGIQVEDVEGYGRNPQGGALESAIERQACVKKIPLKEAKHGDVLLMRFDGEPQHLAILAGDTIIHAYAHARKVCEHIYSAEWKGRTVAAYRVIL